MELTFRELDKAQKAALDLVNFGKVRIERCYRMIPNKATNSSTSGATTSTTIDVVYKLYMEILWADEELLKTLEEYSDDFEEDMADVRNMLAAREIVLKEILRSLENGEKGELELIEAVQSRLETCEFKVDGASLKVFASREAIKSLIDDLEEEGFVIKDELGRISLGHASRKP